MKASEVARLQGTRNVGVREGDGGLADVGQGNRDVDAHWNTTCIAKATTFNKVLDWKRDCRISSSCLNLSTFFLPSTMA